MLSVLCTQFNCAKACLGDKGSKDAKYGFCGMSKVEPCQLTINVVGKIFT